MAPKAAMVVMRRPAAVRPPRRRPAALGDEEVERREDPPGQKRFVDINPRALLSLGTVAIEEGRYYGRTVAVAGKFKSFRSEGDEIYAELVVSGTKDEELLRILSGKEERSLSIHLCGPECPGVLTDETLVHAHNYEEVDARRLPWLTNLEKVKTPERDVDEMARLRDEQRRMEAEKKEADKKEDRKEKKRKRKEEKEGRRSKSPKEEKDYLDPGQKQLEAVFKDTGMDPDPSRRARVMRKARRLLKSSRKKKKKAKGSSSSVGTSKSSSSSTSSLEAVEEGLYDEEQKLQAVWRRYPGTLTARSLQEIRRSLVTAAGTMWSVDRATLPPLYTQYGRQVVLPAMSPALQQEALTLCQTMDYIIQGKVAAGLDILNQRLKSIVALSKGSHWSLGRQYELIKVDERGFAEECEMLSAARRAKEDEKLKNLMGRPGTGKGADYSQGGKTRKGKDTKGTSKGQSTDAGKNKGGGTGKDDRRRDARKSD